MTLETVNPLPPLPLVNSVEAVPLANWWRLRLRNLLFQAARETASQSGKAAPELLPFNLGQAKETQP